MNIARPEDLFICGKCHTNFTDLNIFLTHRSTCVDEQPTILCPISSCPLTAFLSADLETLVDDITSDLPLTSVEQMIVINETMDTNVSASLSRSSNEDSVSEATFDCPVCDRQFELQNALENHIFEHSIWIRNDENTNASFMYNIIINAPLECKQCALTFASNTSLHIHEKMFHGLNLVFRCLNETCSQLFDKPMDYIRHARIHSQRWLVNVDHLSQKDGARRRLRRIHRCKICKKLFPTSDQLKYHLYYEKHQFFCQLCPAEFETSNSYHNHLAEHSDLALHRCTRCSKSFFKRTELSRHMVVEHNNEISQQKICSICNLTFSTRFHLNRHNATKHSVIKPFKCKENGCEQAFARKDKLKQHEAKHSAKGGMYTCEDCNKVFVRYEHLRDHSIAKHSHQYPFSCEHCGKSFIHQSQLYEHYKQNHSHGKQTTNEQLTLNRCQSSNEQSYASLQP
ncbi:unnamed protein product [Adineta ricciae]|uniref:C2H2-type domain-containing protein n=1 Tax=Adineta ricciae TaxID=249248 RepID=A0A814JV54_ADIRI|nr:unnamed protein product [Adineta ricciae]CAF1400353.1 unnamed protein product [Adineta ricciae]